MNYDEYYELSERAGWRTTDIDWSQLEADVNAGLFAPFDRHALIATAVIEHGVPHYADVWARVEGLKDDWELWQFTTQWTGDEHRHSFALKKACELARLHDVLEPELQAVAAFPFAQAQKESCPEDCYRTVPGMLTYAMIQELATNRFYTMAAKTVQSPTLRTLFSKIAADEMRHHVYFRDGLRARYEASADKPWFVDQVFAAAQAFKMPHLIYHLQEGFFEGGDWNIGQDMMVQLGRCFSFDMSLLMRLAQRNPVTAPVAEPAPLAAVG